ncbi:NAD(P)-dependent oxidoreductase [Algimonas porphyrae]|uniref:NAD(P)-dependent oxidoreductase n=2 Tax=Algimonas porphyrae TaxID=1128113 RepID=A0ABQ5UX45_9PROT|nr:NAD(P)-dependent oxidoreductase [Algimonas porphyrae]
MHPRVTLQLPLMAQPPVIVQGATALLIGHGYVAQALGPVLTQAGVTVRHTVRDGDGLVHGSRAMQQAFQDADLILVSVPPGRGGPEPTIAALDRMPTKARWIGYLSATSVYGDRQGQWAYEGEAPSPSLARGHRRAYAELAWLEHYPQTQIFRLAGIYGPGRAPFSRIRAGTARIVDVPGHVVNRIHVLDIVSALMASIVRPSPQDIYNLADGHPAPPGEVLRYAASLIEADEPSVIGLDDPSLSEMARSFYAEAKRIDIGRAQARLGWTPQFRTYAEGLRSVLASERKTI